MEILHEEHLLRVVRLESAYDGYNGCLQTIAELGVGLVTLTHMHSKNKPKSFSLSPDNMTRLAHAWLAFVADQEQGKEDDKKEYRSQVDALRERAKGLYCTIEEDSDGLFTLLYENSPLAHVYRGFAINAQIDIEGIELRLNAAEEMRQDAQTKSCSDGVYNYHINIGDLEIRLRRVHVELHYQAPGFYSLDMDKEHMFSGFWYSNELLEIGQIEYRTDYMESVAARQ